MYTPNVETIVETAVKKKEKMNESLPRYIVSAMLAGAYVGLGIILIFSIGAPLAAAKSPYQTMLMGMSFGLALTLVVFAGSGCLPGTICFLRRARWRGEQR